jgi:tetratricopeptide (TPR) repeat protein
VGGETRFVLLETLQEYAWERLEASGEAEAVRRAHAAYYLQLAEEAEPALQGPEQGVWLGRLEREHDNLRAALQWAQDSGEAEIGLRLAGALGHFWYLQGHWSEGRRWLDALLALPAPVGDPALAAAPHNQVRVAALNAAAWLAARQFDYERARALAEDSAALARSMDDVPGLIDALRVLEDEARFHRFVLDEARELGTQSVALARSIADDWRTARALLWLGCDVGEAGDPARAVALWEESGALYRACGDSDGRAYALFQLGELSNDTGKIAQAVRYLQDALALRGTRASCHRATTTLILAEARMNQGAYREAEALFEEALTIFRMVGSSSQAAHSQTHLALLSLARGKDRRAEGLLEESLRQARAIEAPFEVARALLAQGDLLTYRGLYDPAEETYRESIQLFERMQVPPAIAWVLRPYGVLAQRQGRLAVARERLERGLTLLQGEWRPYYAPIPTALGRVAAEEGNLDEAAGNAGRRRYHRTRQAARPAP